MVADSLDPSLLSAGKKPKLGGPPLPTRGTARLRRILRHCALASIFLLALTFFLFLKLPDSLIANMVLGQLNANTGYRWEASSLDMKVFLLPHLRAEKLKMESLDGTVPPITFDVLKLYPSFLSLIPWTGSVNPKVSFSGDAYQNSFGGSVRAGSGLDLNLEAEDTELSKILPLVDSGLGLKGVLGKTDIELSLPGHDLSKSDGRIEITGKNLSLDPSIIAQKIGMVMPLLNLGALEVQVKLNKGTALLERVLVGAPDRDLQLRIEGDIKLARNPAFSQGNLRLQIRPTEKLFAGVSGLKAILEAFATLRPDGFYAVKLTGPLTAMVPSKD